MTRSISSAALTSPAATRNREPILRVLQAHLPDTGFVLEVASGSGEHAIHVAAACPNLVWQPTDPDGDALASIAAWRDSAGLANVLPPLRLDAADPRSWPLSRADVVVAINMIHIAPWVATKGLIEGAGQLLPRDGLLFLYGPYLEAGHETAPSNLMFDASLKRRDPLWGLRRLEDVTALASQYGLSLCNRIPMPANNLALFFHKA